MRGLYFDQLHTYITDKNKIDEAVNFVKKYQINDITFYAGRVVPEYSEQLAYFITELRKQNNMFIRVAIGSINESNRMFDFHTNKEMFDGMVLEYEWWNHKPRDFDKALSILQYVRLQFPKWFDIAVYIGRIQDNEIQLLVDNSDKIFITSYVDRPAERLFSYAKERYESFGTIRIPANRKAVFVPLFSSEFHPCEICNQGRSHPEYFEKMCFLGKWMSMNNTESQNAFSAVETIWFVSNHYDEEKNPNSLWRKKSEVGGFYYYGYTHFLSNGIN